MARTYNNISELYREVQGIKLIDLTAHVFNIPDNLLEALKPARDGLYVPGFIEPAFIKDSLYYVSPKPDVITKITFEDILADVTKVRELPPGDIYNENRKLHMRRSLYSRLKKEMSTRPSVPSGGFEVAVAVVINYLNTLSKHTNVAHRHYDLWKLIKEDFHYVIDQELFENALESLLTEVKEFVGIDTWNLYFYRISGMTLRIEKGLDFRIVDWTIDKIKASEGYDHDRGGIDDAYTQWHSSSKDS